MLYFVRGNLLDAPTQALVNTVNCVGVMGKGLALAFRRRYRGMYRDCVERCKRGEVHLREPYAYRVEDRVVINFPTKADWHSRSQLPEIEKGLAVLRDRCKEWSIHSLSVPALGCGNGGLEWDDVRPLIQRYLGKLSLDVLVYVPDQSSEPTVDIPLLQPCRVEQLALNLAKRRCAIAPGRGRG